MIKNLIFDIGNVILNFDLSRVIQMFTKDEKKQEFIIDNIINSPEWLQYALIDTGFISMQDAISIVEDRTNHKNDKLIEQFWYGYNNYIFINENALNLIKKLKQNYNIYLLSNINSHTYEHIKSSELFNIVDGYVLSYIEHQVKPNKSIYLTLLNRYKLNSDECLFIDDNDKNVMTANGLGIQGKNVKPDDYNSIINLLDEFKIKY